MCRDCHPAETVENDGARCAEQVPKGESVSEFVNQHCDQDSCHPNDHMGNPKGHIVIDTSEHESRDQGGYQPKERLNDRWKTEKAK